MSASNRKLYPDSPSRKTRKGREKATYEIGGVTQRRAAFLNKEPRGPYKAWARTARRALYILDLGPKDASTFNVSPTWFKKAIDGFYVNRTFRERFESILTGEWQEPLKSNPSLGPLIWPPYVEDNYLEHINESHELAPSIAVQHSEILKSDANLLDEGPAANLAEGAWPLHQNLEKPYPLIAETVEKAIDGGNIDFAFPEFRRTLFHSGYHEQWEIRRSLTEKILKAKLGPRDKAWIWLKAKAYMEMELRNFTEAQAAINEAVRCYKDGQSEEGYGLCLRYLGDLFAKFRSIAKAMKNKLNSLQFLKGTPRRESELELELLRLQYLTDPSEQKIKQLTQLCNELRDIRSWRFALADLEKAKTMRDLGDPDAALIVAKNIELTFRTELTMERTRKLAVSLIADLQEMPRVNKSGVGCV